MRGLIIRSQSGFYSVETETGNLTCRLRGRLKQGKRLGDIVAVGDWVQVTQLVDETGMIEAVEPRQHMLARMAPTPRGEYQQIIIANPDQAVFVFACAKPEPHPGMLDRFLVVAEKQGLPVLIVVNKVDLIGVLSGTRRIFTLCNFGISANLYLHQKWAWDHGIDAMVAGQDICLGWTIGCG